MKSERAIENKIKELYKEMEEIEKRSEKRGFFSMLDRDSYNRKIAKTEALEWVLNDGSLFTDL